MFVYEPALLMLDPALYGKTRDLVTADWTRIVWASSTATIGCVLLAAGLAGYLLAAASLWQRALLVVAALCLIDPGLWTDIAGAVLLLLVVAVQLIRRRRLAETVLRPGG
jgi:TRAP-type uncharacterized transport system fused permease subunit